MRPASHSTRNALIGFVLIAAVVLGGMTWATVATVRLQQSEAERRYQDALRQQQDAVRYAVLGLDSVVMPLLLTESGRAFSDYGPLVRPEEAYWVTGQRLPAGRVVLPSKLVRGPGHELIESYFRIGPDWVWSSPELPDDSDPVADGVRATLDAERVEAIRERIVALSASLTVPELERKLAWSANLETQLLSNVEPAPDATPASVAARPKCCDGDCPDHPACCAAYARSLRGVNFAEQIKVPDPSCELTAEAARSIARQSPRPPDAADASVAASTEDVIASSAVERSILTLADQSEHASVEVTRLRPLWLTTGGGGARKLGFVRTAYVDGQKQFQGFTVDWARLNAHLQRSSRVRALFPLAELVPVNEDDTLSPGLLTTMMHTIPVRLDTKQVLAMPVVSGWRSIQGTLLATWGAAIVVLGVAGLAMRNLVALTNRRMQFAYAVTHELRTPLTTFRLYSDMLSAGLVPSASKQKYLDTLNTESQRLSNLVENVLEYARLEHQRVRLNPAETDIGTFNRTMAEVLERRCEQTGVKGITRNGVASHETLRTDVDLTKQIVGVLVNNACRHARESADPTVVLSLEYAKGKLHVEVVDSGPGVDRRDARAIFRTFRRGRRADSTAQGGIGLGLALARDWAKLLGGRLELAAHRDPQYGGARFRLTVPGHIET